MSGEQHRDPQPRLNDKSEQAVRKLTSCGKRKPRTRPAATYFVEVDAACCKVSLFDAACRDYYRARLFEALTRHGAALHAYSLLERSSLLLISAQSHGSLERLLTEAQRAYLVYFNARFERQQRSPRSYVALCELHGKQLVRACYRYVERAPLQTPESCKLGDYPWSSYSANGFGQGPPKAELHSDRLEQRLQRHKALAQTLPRERPLAAYRDFLSRPMDPIAERALAAALRRQSRLGESEVYLGGG